MDKIGIAITTRNRPNEFSQVYEAYKRLTPDAVIVVVDDASDIVYCEADYTFRKRAGIPRAKNKCIELLYNAGCTHLFLSDDDTYPLCDVWWKPYVESPYEHLCYTFMHGREYNGHKRHTLGNGCMMYMTRNVIDTIGGFDICFGLGKYEHTQYSWRVHAFGITPFPFLDVAGSDKLLYCMDSDNGVQRSFTKDEMKMLLKDGYKRFLETKGKKIKINFAD